MQPLKKILVIENKYREPDKEQLPAPRYNRVFSDSASIIDLPPQLSEVLIDNDMVMFKVISWCMFPVIWAGDTLKVEPIKPQDAKIGDIVLYKSAGLAFAHRLVKTYTKKNRLYIITSGEKEFRDRQFNYYANVQFNNCSGIPLDNILGRIVEIKRGQLRFKPDKANESLRSLTQGRLKLLLWILMRLMRKTNHYIAKIFINLQRVKLYRYRFRAFIRNKASFFVGTALIKNTPEFNNFCFYRGFEDFSKNFADSEGLYNISARINNNTIGNISLFLERTDNRKVCTLSDFIVRIRYRGAGIGCQLLEKALYLCDKINVEEIKIELAKENRIAVNLFNKFGFEIR